MERGRERGRGVELPQCPFSKTLYIFFSPSLPPPRCSARFRLAFLSGNPNATKARLFLLLSFTLSLSLREKTKGRGEGVG